MLLKYLVVSPAVEILALITEVVERRPIFALSLAVAETAE